MLYGMHGSNEEKSADVRRAQKSNGGDKKEKAKNETRNPPPPLPEPPLSLGQSGVTIAGQRTNQEPEQER